MKTETGTSTSTSTNTNPVGNPIIRQGEPMVGPPRAETQERQDPTHTREDFMRDLDKVTRRREAPE